MTTNIKTVWQFPKDRPQEAPEQTRRVFLLNKAVLQKVGIVHIFDEMNAKGGLTVAFKKTSPYKSGAMVTVAVATCSKLDAFSKKIGTERALEMFFTGQTIQLPLLQTFAEEDLAYAVKNAFRRLYDYI